MNEQLLSLLGLVRKAGLLSLGFDSVKEAAQSRKAEIVFLANDLSPKTEKEAKFFLNKTNTRLLKLSATIDDFEHALAKRVGIISINEIGFAKKAEMLCKAQNERGVNYDDKI